MLSMLYTRPRQNGGSTLVLLLPPWLHYRWLLTKNIFQKNLSLASSTATKFATIAARVGEN